MVTDLLMQLLQYYGDNNDVNRKSEDVNSFAAFTVLVLLSL